MSAERTTLLVVDDQRLVREGFAMILNAQPDLDVVGTAADGAEAVRECARLTPAVVLMDVRMPVMDGIEATRRICAVGAAKVLMLTTFDLDEYVYDAIRAGASGFLLKDVPASELGHGVRAVAAGETLLAPSITRRLVEHFVQRPAPGRPGERLSALTPRERDVLAAVGRGLSNTEVAAELFLSETTVKTHLGRILTKLRLRDRVQAVVLAYESGLIEPGGQ
ncbi:response regulator transcription factor [Sinomonas sp. ASV486]|uniref:Response regulator n=1 Tax=Sinomonas puerhi TaxID=3238584 RepID=A0AB39L527_9MICC|nr:response regulator transcription factor [Sinomonas sp. ASV486]MDQ4492316.1 response regulator transcription factor [Sinomonas sp. ASV486]